MSIVASSPLVSDPMPPFQGQGRIGIYDTQSDYLMELNAEYAEVAKSLHNLQSRYGSLHPTVATVKNHLEHLQTEIDTVLSELKKTAARLSEDEQAALIERYQTHLEIEASRKRLKLAKLKTRYKEKFPTVIEAAAQLESIEARLDAFRDQQIATPVNRPMRPEQVRIELMLADSRAQLESLSLRYREKHPHMIEARLRIKALEDQLAAFSDQPVSDRKANSNANEARMPNLARHQQDVSLAREEIQLIEEHLQQRLESNSSDVKSLHLERLELLELKQELAAMEGHREMEATSLDKQRSLLEQLLKSATSPEEIFQLKRQLINVKRAQLRVLE